MPRNLNTLWRMANEKARRQQDWMPQQQVSVNVPGFVFDHHVQPTVCELLHHGRRDDS